MSAPIRVGIVGLSASAGWAAAAHVPALAALDAYELSALAAGSAESARAAGAKYGVAHTHGTVEELVERDDIDLVVVTVKAPQHRRLVLAALQAGKMVWCEWPLGTGLAEATELAALAQARQLRTVVGLQARCSPAIRYLRDLVASGYLGEVLSTSVVASGRNWGATFATRGAYPLDPANGVTMLSVPFGHTVDALTLVLGEFTDLSATIATRRTRAHDAETGQAAAMRSPDQLAVSGTLEGGAVASLHFRGGLSRGTNFLWEINGTDGDLVVTQDWAHPQFGAISLRGARGRDTTPTELPVPGHYLRVPELADARDEMAYNVAHTYAQLREDLSNGTELAPGFAHAAHRQRLLDRIEHAAHTGERQKF
jgi:predicted dehydrogenase